MSHDPKVDDELAGWRSEWQTMGDAAALTTDLADRCAREGRRLRRSIVLEVAAATVSTLFMLAQVVKTRGAPPVVAICGGIAVFNAVWVTYFAVARRGALELEGTSLAGFVALTRRRLDSELALGRFAFRAHLALLAFLVPGLAWLFATRADRLMREPWRLAIALVAAVGIHAVLFAWLRRKRDALEVKRRRFEELVARAELG